MVQPSNSPSLPNQPAKANGIKPQRHGQPAKKFSELSPHTRGRMNQMAQIRRLQRALIAKAEEEKITGNTLAQIARSWSLLESQRQRLKGLIAPVRLADSGAPVATANFAASTGNSNPGEAIMLDDDSLLDDQTDQSLPIVIRKPPEREDRKARDE